MPAIIGEMAGDVITFFTSNPITAFLAAYQIGEIIKQIIHHVKSKGKTITVEKESIKYIGTSNLNRGECDENYKPIIWGPMTITDPNKLKRACQN